jgi:predicted nucleic acid-binding protein
MGLIADLGPGPVAIDTSIFIYFIEEEPRFLRLVLPLFEEADAGKKELITSAVTLLEVLVVPYRAGDVQLAERYELLLTRSRGIRMIDLTHDQLRAAAQLRAATGAKTPDALQLVSALGTGCRTFVTTDRGLPRVRGLRVIQLSSYVDSSQ